MDGLIQYFVLFSFLTMMLHFVQIRIVKNFVFFYRVLLQEGMEIYLETRGDILTKFRPTRSHEDPVRVHFYNLWGPDLRICLQCQPEAVKT